MSQNNDQEAVAEEIAAAKPSKKKAFIAIGAAVVMLIIVFGVILPQIVDWNLVGEAIRAKYHWVPMTTPIYMYLDNAGGQNGGVACNFDSAPIFSLPKYLPNGPASNAGSRIKSPTNAIASRNSIKTPKR